MRIVIGAVAVVLLVGVVAVRGADLGDGRATTVRLPPPERPPDLARARRSELPFYWLGESFAGLPLTALEGDGAGTFTAYGTCEAVHGSEGGCAPPVQIVTHHCVGRRVSIAVFAGVGATDLAVRATDAVRPLNRAARTARAYAPSIDSMKYCARARWPGGGG